MRLLSKIKYDIIFQFRHGFYYVYGFVCLFYIIMLQFIPTSLKEIVLIIIIFIDTSLLGFFFIGGVVLLEKRQRILDSIFVSPYRVTDYIISKIISLTVLALISSLIILLTAFGIKGNLAIFTFVVAASSILFTLLGLALVSYVKSINQYFLWSIGFILFFVVPVIDFFKIYESYLFYIIPTKSTLLLLEYTFNNMNIFNFIINISIIITWIIIIFIITGKIFLNKVIMRIGEEN